MEEKEVVLSHKLLVNNEDIYNEVPPFIKLVLLLSQMLRVTFPRRFFHTTTNRSCTGLISVENLFAWQSLCIYEILNKKCMCVLILCNIECYR